MSGIFLKAVNMSISAGWIVLAVTVLRLILKKAPAWIHVALWAIVAVRLMVPFTVQSTWSLLPSSETFPERVISGPEFDVQTGITPVDEQINRYLDARYFEGVTVQADNGSRIMSVLSVIWIIGILILTVYAAVSCRSLKRKVETAVRYRDNIFQSEKVNSPFVFGILRTRIYLPFQTDEKDLPYIIAHEQAHIQRKDHLWKALGFLLLIIYWFHPLMWLAYRMMCRDIELACDQKVIGKLGNKQRADYTQALLHCSLARKRTAAGLAGFGETGVRERVKSVLNYRKPTGWLVAVSAVLCAAAAFCFLTDPVRKEFEIKIAVPAGNQERFVYSEEEISPVANSVTVLSGRGLGDTEVVLKASEENTGSGHGEPVYLTPGMAAKMDAEKGRWFRIGVNVQNQTEEQRVVWIRVKNAEVRAAETGSGGLEQYRTQYIGDAPKVSAIAQNLTYPEGYSYSSIRLETDTEPYELVVFLDGDERVQEEAFRDCAAAAFDLIGNMGVISFCSSQSESVLASFERSGF